MTADPSISVVICTYSLDRWTDLVRSVESVRAQTVAVAEIVLVVDHNDQLLARATAAWPDLAIVPNAEEQGLSGGRNTGLAPGRWRGDRVPRRRRRCRARLARRADPRVSGPFRARCRRREPAAVGPRPPELVPQEFDWVVGMLVPRPSRALGADSQLHRQQHVVPHAARCRTVGGFNAALGRVGLGGGGVRGDGALHQARGPLRRHARSSTSPAPGCGIASRRRAGPGATSGPAASRRGARRRSSAAWSARAAGSSRSGATPRGCCPALPCGPSGTSFGRGEPATPGGQAPSRAGLAMTAMGFLQGIVFRPRLSG